MTIYLATNSIQYQFLLLFLLYYIYKWTGANYYRRSARPLQVLSICEAHFRAESIGARPMIIACNSRTLLEVFY